MNKKSYALQLVKYRHLKAIEEKDKRLFSLRQDKKFASLEYVLESLQWQSAKNIAYDKPNQELIAKIADAQKNIDEYLVKNKLPVDCLNVKIYCTFCNDTGILNGKLCSCAEKLRIKLVIDEFPILEGLPTCLKDINFAFYKDKANFYKKCASFMEKNFTDKKSFITLMGGAGVGKTYLAATAIKQALYMGKTINILNTISLNRIFLEYHCALLSSKNAIWHQLIDSDIMLIDDLGTEQILNNVTMPYLYQLMVERLGKQTIFTTNMELRDLEAKYGQRILSRLCEKRNSAIIPVYIEDLRFN